MRRTFAVLFMTGGSAWAHSGERLRPHDLWNAWSWDPAVVFLLLLSAWLYAKGASREHGTSRLEAVCFIAGWLSLFIALISPLHPLGEVLFSAHMTQHEILMLISAPLLVMSRPITAFLWALPYSWRRTAGRWSKSGAVQSVWRPLTLAWVAWTVHAIVLWGWHAPVLFQATLRSDFVHTLQHVSFLGSALLFWWSLIHTRQARNGYGVSVLYVFTTALHTSILGALLTFSPTVWYPAYAATAPEWGLTALEDQQIGGLIMWVPAGLVYLAAGLWLCALWIRDSEWRVIQRGFYVP